MTADLVARLEARASRLCGPDAAETVALLREAASALRSSGEAVAYLEEGTLNSAAPDDYRRCVETWPGDYQNWFPVFLHPATPASAWRPIAEAPRDGTQILGYWPDRGCHAVAFCSDGWWRRAQDEGALTPPVLWQSITPPTSTKGG